MKKHIKQIFLDENIEYAQAIPFSLLTKNPHCRRTVDFIPTSVIMLAVPYFIGAEKGNVSLYARARDYHLYFSALGERIVSELKSLLGCNASLFADTSPIYEREAASLCGLGIIGKNGMLITEKYSSFVFLGSIFTDADIEDITDKREYKAEFCENCNACISACPFGLKEKCLSQITQSKGDISEDDARLMKVHETVWGCDICQLVCPHTKKLIASGITTPIDFFKENTIKDLNAESVADMDDDFFKQRAFSWRGKKVLERNVKICKKD